MEQAEALDTLVLQLLLEVGLVGEAEAACARADGRARLKDAADLLVSRQRCALAWPWPWQQPFFCGAERGACR